VARYLLRTERHCDGVDRGGRVQLRDVARRRSVSSMGRVEAVDAELQSAGCAYVWRVDDRNAVED